MEFKLDPQVTILVLDQSGALGLDLSFVSHVWLMEPLADASLEQQVMRGREEGGGGAAAEGRLAVGTGKCTSLDTTFCVRWPSNLAV